jgi:hypothetical protein
MRGTELALVKNAPTGAQRVSRFGMEVMDDVDNSPDAEPSENSRLRREIEALAMREASLRSLQKTMAEVDRGGKLAPTQHTDLDELRSAAACKDRGLARAGCLAAVPSITCWSFESSRRRASAFASTRTGGNARHPRDHGGCADRTPPCNMPSSSQPGSPALASLSTRSSHHWVETVSAGQRLLARMARRLGWVP